LAQISLSIRPFTKCGCFVPERNSCLIQAELKEEPSCPLVGWRHLVHCETAINARASKPSPKSFVSCTISGRPSSLMTSIIFAVPVTCFCLALVVYSGSGVWIALGGVTEGGFTRYTGSWWSITNRVRCCKSLDRASARTIGSNDNFFQG